MNLTPGNAHLTALDTFIELRGWLADNVEMQAAPAIVAHLPSSYRLTQKRSRRTNNMQVEHTSITKPGSWHQRHDPDIPTSPTRSPYLKWPCAFQGLIPMSAFMIDSKDYQSFAVLLHRFCNAPMPPHYTLELLHSRWLMMPPMNVTSTWAWRVGWLAPLMMLANRRAVWHRYQLGRQQGPKEPRQHRSTKQSPLKPVHRYHQAPLTDAELVTLYKFSCCALYPSSEWSGRSEQAPRLVKVIQRLQQGIAQDVLTRLSLWGQARWGEMR
ncbi:hypothetical protein ACB295_10995 [Aeromonas caviae]|uniref:hypothetical protein n=1 Tax=Aeromonas caviae TaxID=648 RepID=UPI00214DFA78|nr:hypothetical protein [Aeromonas caviae]MCR3927616.1 hypothetical protein [Aeromonas caviae]